MHILAINSKYKRKHPLTLILWTFGLFIISSLKNVCVDRDSIRNTKDIIKFLNWHSTHKLSTYSDRSFSSSTISDSFTQTFIVVCVNFWCDYITFNIMSYSYQLSVSQGWSCLLSFCLYLSVTDENVVEWDPSKLQLKIYVRK